MQAVPRGSTIVLRHRHLSRLSRYLTAVFEVQEAIIDRRLVFREVKGRLNLAIDS